MFNLFQQTRAMKQNEKGFTLVELMVVVAIIGVLVAIAIPVYGGIQQTARDNACQANVRTLQGAVSMFEAESGNPPIMIEHLWDGHDGFGPYIEEEPECPNEGTYDFEEGSERKVECDCGADDGGDPDPEE